MNEQPLTDDALLSFSLPAFSILRTFNSAIPGITEQTTRVEPWANEQTIQARPFISHDGTGVF